MTSALSLGLLWGLLCCPGFKPWVNWGLLNVQQGQKPQGSPLFNSPLGKDLEAKMVIGISGENAH